MSSAGAYQRLNARPALSLAAFAAAARERRRRLPRPRRAQQAVRSGRCAAESSDRAHSRLGRPLLPVRRTRGRGGRGEGGTIIAFSGSILGDARRPLSALAARSTPFDPAAAWRNRLFAPLHDSLCGCCCSQGKGRRRRERAGSSCTRSRHEKDDDKKDKKKVETVLISTI